MFELIKIKQKMAGEDNLSISVQFSSVAPLWHCSLEDSDFIEAQKDCFETTSCVAAAARSKLFGTKFF